MNVNPQSMPDSAGDCRDPIHHFVAMAANVLDAFTTALLLQDQSCGGLRMIAFQSLSDHIVADACFPLDSGFWSEAMSKGGPIHETYFEGDSTQFGIYSNDVPIRSYMIAPVEGPGLLWVDTRRTYRFTDKHLKILAELAKTAGHLLVLGRQARLRDRALLEVDLIRHILPDWQELPELDHWGLDTACKAILDGREFDGVLAALRQDGTDLLKIVASEGFSSWVRPGRLVRSTDGLAGLCMENRLPILVPDTEDSDASRFVFHKGERFGFDLKSLAVVPLFGVAEDGILLMASKRAAQWRSEDEVRQATLGKVIGLIQSAACQNQVLKGVRRHDGESGLMSEGYFRKATRSLFSRVSQARGRLFLLLVLITDIDRIYLEHDYPAVYRFLEATADVLQSLACRNKVAGKFRTGGFGVLLEGIAPGDVDLLVEKAKRLLGEGILSVEGAEVRYDFRLGTAHYPHECDDFIGLWRTALNRLEPAVSEA